MTIQRKTIIQTMMVFMVLFYTAASAQMNQETLIQSKKSHSKSADVRGRAGSYTDEQRFEYNLALNEGEEQTYLSVHNIYGSISVEGYTGTDIQIVAIRKVFSESSSDVDVGIKEVNVKTAFASNTHYVYLDAPFSEFDVTEGGYVHHNRNRSYHHKPRPYTYVVDITIQVPQGVGLSLNAVNDGDILVENMRSPMLQVNNVNGAITMNNVIGQTQAKSVNKDIRIVYAENPSANSSYESINGDVKIQLQDKANFTISYQTMNGDFYTNLDVLNIGPKIIKEQLPQSSGIKYKILSKRQLQVGEGGTELHFETLNGDIDVKS